VTIGHERVCAKPHRLCRPGEYRRAAASQRGGDLWRKAMHRNQSSFLMRQGAGCASASPDKVAGAPVPPPRVPMSSLAYALNVAAR